MAVTTLTPPAADTAKKGKGKKGKGGDGADAEGGGGGKKKLIIILVAVLALGGAAYWFFLRPKPEPAPEPGEVVAMEPIQVNLAGGHYLKIGIALQLTTAAHEADGSKALDAVIDLFSGKSMHAVTRADEREHLKKELTKELEHAYHGDVMDVYFTDFVTQ
jgi:flagellar FliL protein